MSQREDMETMEEPGFQHQVVAAISAMELQEEEAEGGKEGQGLKVQVARPAAMVASGL